METSAVDAATLQPFQHTIPPDGAFTADLMIPGLSGMTKAVYAALFLMTRALINDAAGDPQPA